MVLSSKPLAVCVLVAAALIPSPVFAQNAATVTLSSEVKPIMHSGEIDGCALNFAVGRSDPEYNDGKPVYISGSLNLYPRNQAPPVFALKLGVKSAAVGDTEFVAPTEAYLLSGLHSNRADFAGPLNGDLPGFRLFVFEIGDATTAAALESVAKTKTLTFSYAMRTGGMGAIVPVDLRVHQINLAEPSKTQFDDGAPAAWLACIHGALSTQMERLER